MDHTGFVTVSSPSAPSIDSFVGEFTFLRSDYSVNVEFDNSIYPSLEHAFQAAKTNDLVARAEIRVAKTAQDARALGKKLQLDPTWDKRRLEVMKQLIQQKFKSNLDLKLKLLRTGQRNLIQGGMHRDHFWGQDRNGIGENYLGKLLMEVRGDIRATDGSAEKVLSKFLADSGLGFIADDISTIFRISGKIGNSVTDTVDTDQVKTILSAME